MSLERIAEILCVDEVKVNHGPLGVSIRVRSGETWSVANVDHGDLVKSRGPDDHRTPERRRLEVIANHLAFLADADIARIRDPRKAAADDAARAKVHAINRAFREAELDAQRRADRLGAPPSVFSVPQASDALIATYGILKSSDLVVSPPAADPEPQSAEKLPSRFHAIMAELMCL